MKKKEVYIAKICICLIVIISGLHTSCKMDNSQSKKPVSKFEELDTFIKKEVSKHNLVGMSVAVVKKGEAVWSKGYGYANIDSEILATSDTPFHLASVSKVVTGTALMHAWENGAFDLDQNINELLPFIVDNPHVVGEAITILHLATHTSGIITNFEIYKSYYEPGDSEVALGDFLNNYLVAGNNLYDAKSNFLSSMPGEKYSYSNIATGLAGYIVETTTELPLDKYTKTHMFEPLGMENTYWKLADFADQGIIAVPYEEDKTPTTLKYFPDSEQLHYGFPTWPDGQLRSSANDLARFLAAIMNKGELNGTRIIQKSTIDILLQPQFPDIEKDGIEQAFFWIKSGDLFYHDGDDPGASTLLFFDLESEVGGVILMNVGTNEAQSLKFEILEKIRELGKDY